MAALATGGVTPRVPATGTGSLVRAAVGSLPATAEGPGAGVLLTNAVDADPTRSGAASVTSGASGAGWLSAGVANRIEGVEYANFSILG